MTDRIRFHPSGSSKRKAKRQRDERNEELRSSLKKFLVPCSSEENAQNAIPENIPDVKEDEKAENNLKITSYSTEGNAISENDLMKINSHHENILDINEGEKAENNLKIISYSTEGNDISANDLMINNSLHENIPDININEGENAENNLKIISYSTEGNEISANDLMMNNNRQHENMQPAIGILGNIETVSCDKKENESSPDPDPATWANNPGNNFIDYFIKNPPEQNIDLASKSAKLIANKKRCLTKNSFFRLKKNNEVVKREWLILSPSTLSLFCWVCKIFSKVKTALTSTGLNDWKHVNDRICEHENSSHHRDAIISMSLRANSHQRIDSTIVAEFNKETMYWRDVLRRVVATVKYLSKRGLSFFGSDEEVGSIHNGNFLGCLELISEFDSFTANHLNRYGNCGTGRANYISSTTINEFIDIMSQKVQKEIINEVKDAKYFSIITDSTPDVSHVDQLCLVIRYVAQDNLPVERFLMFIPTKNHSAEYLFETISACLKDLNLDILECRGQSYDNASNMAGRYSGLQARLKAVNPYANYVPCAAHSLNLVGSNAAEANLNVSKFFGLLQQIYNFFSVSTHRWQLVNSKIKEKNASFFTLKSRSNTRWSANAEAVKALHNNYKSVSETLAELACSENESSMTKNEAKSLYDALNTLETVISLIVWNTILQRLNSANKIVQDPSVNLSTLPILFQSLIDFVQFVRGNFDNYEKEASIILPNVSYAVTRTRSVPKNKWLDDNKNCPETHFSSREAYIVSIHYTLCDNLISHLNRRKEPYMKIVENFSCLINLKSTLSLNDEAKTLQECYPDDISEDFSNELQQFRTVITDENQSIPDMFKIMKELNLSSAFPNVETALRIFLSIPISNCSGERSFSLLKRLKSKNRSTMDQNKLSKLALLCMENDVTDKLNYEDVISSFAEKKLRKMSVKI